MQMDIENIKIEIHRAINDLNDARENPDNQLSPEDYVLATAKAKSLYWVIRLIEREESRLKIAELLRNAKNQEIKEERK